MFDLTHASSDLKKVAWQNGIRTGVHGAWFKPLSSGGEERAVVGDNTGKEVTVTVFDLEYIHQYSWEEVRRGAA